MCVAVVVKSVSCDDTDKSSDSNQHKATATLVNLVSIDFSFASYSHAFRQFFKRQNHNSALPQRS